MTSRARLRALKLVGFKSFAERTVIEFEAGISAVVGPNGSGKSNLADALRWAFGEQGRSLRTKRSEDVIFAGSATRHATGMADVTLVIDNADRLLPLDYAELELGRRLFRSGENEYLINRQRVRLRDLVDLLDAANLADNAFLFIGQGMVDQALSLRPEERRPLFEEVAGVRRHERRRRHAEGQLAEAEANLARVGDVLAELRPQARRLAAQAEQQAARRQAAEEFAAELVAAAHRRWKDAARSANEALRRRESARERLAALLEQERAHEAELGRLTAELTDRAGVEAARREELDTAREHSVALRLRDGRLQVELVALERDRARLLRDESAIEERLVHGRRTLALPIPSVEEGLETVVADANARLRDATDELQRAQASGLAAEGQREALRRALADRAATHESARRRVAETDRQLADARARLAARRDRANDAEAALAAAATRLADVVASEERAEAVADTAARELAQAEQHARALSERAAALGARRDALAAALAALDARLAAATDSAPPALAGEDWTPLAELEVDAGFEQAFEVALGPALGTVAVGATAVARLSQVSDAAWSVVDGRPGGGEADPATTRSVRPLAAALGGGWLADCLVSDPAGVVARLVGTTLWVPRLEDAIELRSRLPAGWRVVTPGGALVTAEGLIQSARAASLLRHRRERSDVTRDLELAATACDAAAAATAAAGRELAILLDRVGGARRELDAIRRRRRTFEEQERAAGRRAESERRELAWESALLERLEREQADARRALDAAERSAGDGPTGQLADGTRLLAELQSRVHQLRAERDRRRAMLEEALHHRERAVDEQRRAAAAITLDEARLEDVRREMAAVADQAARLSEERSSLAVELTAAIEAEAAVVAGLEELAAGTVLERALLEETERDAAQARSEAHRAEEELRAAELAEAEARLALEALKEQLLVELAALGPLALAVLRPGGGEGETIIESRLAGTLEASEGAEGSIESRFGQLLESALAEAMGAWSREAAMDDSEDDDGGAPGAPSQARLAALRRRYHELGVSNPFAAQEYAEVRERLERMETQRADLEAAIASTRLLIGELRSLVTEQFRATFAALEESFGRQFERLFDGGEAQLILTEPDDLSTTGIDIVARPPGKKRQALAMLSGGERALTAVALLFAMLEVRPVPFCVLDEVDAALDEANIARFAAALRLLAERTQFIVITHNRGTIESADALYGVTIGDDAVSRVISLRLADRTAVATSRALADAGRKPVRPAAGAHSRS